MKKLQSFIQLLNWTVFVSLTVLKILGAIIIPWNIILAPYVLICIALLFVTMFVFASLQTFKDKFKKNIESLDKDETITVKELLEIVDNIK